MLYLEEKYTSYSGFRSNYEPDLGSWIAAIKDEDKLEHRIGSLLEYVLRNSAEVDSIFCNLIEASRESCMINYLQDDTLFAALNEELETKYKTFEEMEKK